MSEQKKLSGRPLKYGEPLISITYRIPKSKVKQATKWVEELKDEVLIRYLESQPKKKPISKLKEL